MKDTPMDDEPLVEQDALLVEQDIPIIPDAQLVFDVDVANLWLSKAQLRFQDAYYSIRFEPVGIPLHHINFILEMLTKAIAVTYKIPLDPEIHVGKLFIPDYLADSPVLSVLKRGNAIGEYVEFYRE